MPPCGSNVSSKRKADWNILFQLGHLGDIEGAQRRTGGVCGLDRKK